VRLLLMPQNTIKPVTNSRGNTILGVLCLIAVSVAAFQMTLSNSLSVNGGIKNSRIVSARDMLESRIKSYSSMGTTFRSSMYLGVPLTVNTELRNCVFGTGTSPCKAIDKHPVALYYPIYSGPGAAGSNLKRISGPAVEGLSASESAFYDNKGNLCIANSTGSLDANCPFFEVTTSFVATCPGGTTTCATAESISVNYMIKTAAALSGSSSQTLASFSMKPIDHSAPPISVADILPAAPGSSSSNVTISLSPSTSTLSLESIQSTLKSLGITDKGQLEEYSLAFQKSGVNDLTKIEFLLKVGQIDPTWMKTVVDSGITDAKLANELYWSQNPWTPELLAASVAAVTNVKVPEVRWAIADRMITDHTIAEQIADAVSSVKNPNVAAGIITGGHEGDPGKVKQIAAALSQIPDPLAEYLAQVGVTDASIAKQITSIVSVLKSPFDAGWVIQSGGGDVAKTQETLTSALAYLANPGTPETTTTTTSTTPGPTPTPPPVEISLMPTCTTCSPVTY
jgi:hypothetical protein